MKKRFFVAVALFCFALFVVGYSGSSADPLATNSSSSSISPGTTASSRKNVKRSPSCGVDKQTRLQFRKIWKQRSRNSAPLRHFRPMSKSYLQILRQQKKARRTTRIQRRRRSQPLSSQEKQRFLALKEKYFQEARILRSRYKGDLRKFEQLRAKLKDKLLGK